MDAGEASSDAERTSGEYGPPEARIGDGSRRRQAADEQNREARQGERSGRCDLKQSASSDRATEKASEGHGRARDQNRDEPRGPGVAGAREGRTHHDGQDDPEPMLAR